MKRKMDKKRWGFTLVELLTTLAVIGVLLGLLIPALNEVSKSATKVKQKAQFHAIGTALEAFRNDYGDYPPSMWDNDLTDGNGIYYGNYSASQRLAEALVGRDGLGFHPDTIWHAGGGGFSGQALYRDHPLFSSLTPAEMDANLSARKGPYLELESANAVRLSNVAPSYIPALSDSYVLVDMYKQVRNAATGKDVGLPILYYKASTMKIGNSGAFADWGTNTYNINDSYCDGSGFIGTGGHYGGDVENNANVFYNAIGNPNFTSPPRPYRAESFILQSAGPDGLYGTMDDIFNFDQNN